MYATVNHNKRIAGFAFAIFMATVINGAMLMKFDHVATDAVVAHSHQSSHVAVLDTVTIVGRRT